MTKHKYLRKELLFLSSLSLLALFSLIGCEKQPDLLFGSTYTDDNTSANIVLVDTSTVLMSTLYVDSTATAATGYHMVGSYNDDYIGKITSRSYFQVAPPNPLPKLDPRSDTYDSIGLVLFAKPGNPYYGDTTVYQTYTVNQIDTLFQFVNNQFAWYSNRTLPIGPDLGSTTVRISPNINIAAHYGTNTSQGTGDTVRIPLDASLGQQLYTMVYNNSDTLTNTTLFQLWFHGLCLRPGGASPANLIYGFKDSCLLRVYYRENGVISTGKFIDFPLTNRTFQYNNIQKDYTGKALNNITRPTTNPQPPPATLSTKIGNAGYVETIGGLNVKLTFPFISTIALRADYIGLLRATLTVRPIPTSFSTTWRLPPTMGIYSTDQNNLLGLPIAAAGIAGNQTGNLVLDYFHPLNTVYTYDVTNFVKTALINPSPVATQAGVYLSIPAPGNTASFNRVILADQSYPIDQRVTLNVYYISLYPHQ